MVAYWERKQVPAEDLGVGWETGVWVWTVKNPENKSLDKLRALPQSLRVQPEMEG